MKFQETFKALSDPTRREIIALLRDKPLHAQQIVDHFQQSNATISHHLSVLKNAELILDEKQGKFIYYELNTSVLDEIIGWISSLKS
ncbi:MAG: winged helix-turn-helix transcriptional regulator [Erysipelotrichaceae bacterium]|nr:winged helix-turn-helix transcriptional regulator [Erysipelotrichaceae bacterium]MCI9525250.1 winged helix-turn-helix transcriptional regulator [Erysipelotrichaceae bacterium]